MKRMTRRLLAMLLAALMMVSALPVYAAGEGTTVLYGESDVFVCQDGTITWIDFVDGLTYGFSAYTEDSLFIRDIVWYCARIHFSTSSSIND